MDAHVLKFQDVSLVRRGKHILHSIDFEVGPSDRWIILGPNGAGKTSLLSLASAMQHPSSGTVDILDQRLGRTDVFEIRPRVGLISTSISRAIPEDETALDAVVTAAFSVTGRWREEYEAMDIDRARRIMQDWQVDHLADRRFVTLSDGERKRVLLARAVMSDPELLLLDEPAASLDLGTRERLLSLLTAYATSPTAPAIVMVTHHVEEIPRGFTHALLMNEGEIFAQGPLDEIVTSEHLSTLYDLPITVRQESGRFSALATE